MFYSEKTIDDIASEYKKIYSTQNENKNDIFEQNDEIIDAIEKSKKLFSLPKKIQISKTSSIINDLSFFESSSIMSDNIQKFVKSLESISPTSTTCERCFSTAGQIISPIRSRIGSDLANAIILSKYFFLNDYSKRD